MKLLEIKDITNLIESLDSHYDFKIIKDTSNQKIYRVEEPKLTAIINFEKFKNNLLAEISFKSDESDYSMLNKFSMKETLKIFGTILNIMKIQTGINIWYFEAKQSYDKDSDHQKRVQFYNRISKKMCSEFNFNY